MESQGYRIKPPMLMLAEEGRAVFEDYVWRPKHERHRVLFYGKEPA